MQKGVDECAGAMPRTGMNNHTRRLVEDHHVIVFIDGAQRQRFRFDGSRFRGRYVDRERLPGTHLSTRPKSSAWPRHTAVLDQALQLRAGLIGEESRQEVVETRAVLIGLDED